MAQTDDYGQMKVTELRKLMREKHEVTRGAFSSEASREECLAILTGQRKAVDVIAEHWQQHGPMTPADGDGPPEGELTELRKVMRDKFPVTRGAFSSEATREECISILTGQRQAVDVIAEHWGQQHTKAGQDLRMYDDSGDGPPEGEHRDDAGGKDDADAGTDLDLEAHDATLEVRRGLDEIEKLMNAIGRNDLVDATAKASSALHDAEMTVRRLRKQAQATGPEPGTDLKATGDTVSIAGHDFPVVLPAKIEAKDENGEIIACDHPDLEAMPDPDPGFKFGLFKARLQCGAVRFEHEATDVLKATVAGDRVLLTGPPGTGKTQMVQQACIRMQWPFERFNGNRDVTQADFVGQYEARDGSTVWVDGPLPRAMRDGKVLILDEFDHMPAECSSIMHSVMEPGGRLVMTAKGGEVVKPHANFRIVATANTAGHGDESGQHPAAQVQDAAMRSRFDLLFHIDYLDVDDEADLVASLTGVDRDEALLMAQVANDSRQSVAAGDMMHAISLRETLAWGRATKRGGDIAYGLAVAVLGKLPTVDRPGMAEIAQRHLGGLLPASLVTDDATPQL